MDAGIATEENLEYLREEGYVSSPNIRVTP